MIKDASRLTRLSKVLEPNSSTTVQKLWAYIVNVQTITIWERIPNLQLDAGGNCESGDEKDMQLHAIAKNGLARPKLLLLVSTFEKELN